MTNLNNFDRATVRIIASSKTWIESEAVSQLKNVAKKEGICVAVGLPDLHPGNGIPVGAAFLSKDIIYPHLIGSDIGCGIGLWQTDILTHKAKPDKWIKLLHGLEIEWQEGKDEWLNAVGAQSTLFDNSLGTIGHGNHFAELQEIEKIIDHQLFSDLKLDKSFLMLLVHSGSRRLGQYIFDSYLDQNNIQGLLEGTAALEQYLALHDNAVRWAKANRALISYRFLNLIKAKGQKILDVEHNIVNSINIDKVHYWLHRKGAVPSNCGAVVIPGSRGSYSYLVQPVGNQLNNLFSLAHGAGRKWKRSDARQKFTKYKKEDLIKTALGGRVICEDKNLLFEEAPEAYKKIDSIIKDLVEFGLIKIIAILKPIITYKVGRPE